MVKLESSRLYLRIIEINDKEAIFAYRSDPEIYKYQSWKYDSIDEIVDLIMNKIVSEPNLSNTWMQLAVCRKEDNSVIGDCGIHFLEYEPKQVEIGITINRENQGKGFGAEALSAVFNYIFNELGKHRIIASIDPANIASIKLMEKIGMRKEAHFRKSILIDGEWADDIIYAILEEEWKTSK